MGTQNVNEGEQAALQEFMRRLLVDLRALEIMLEQGKIESGIRRIGAEQEVFLVDRAWRAAPLAQEVLKRVSNDHFTTELARFNLEVNLDPHEFGGNCLSEMERQINHFVALARTAAQSENADVILTGILPSLHKSDLDLENMTPKPRYAALNDALTALRGKAYEFRISGVDEIRFEHYSVMLEACNTSFQVHFQTGPEEFAELYNVAQAITAPVLAAGVNSPLLFGKRLWRETRIALFQQSVDTRGNNPHLREIRPRVSFGDRWLEESVLEIFQDDIARFKVLLSTDLDDDPFAALEAGRAPKLQALQLHNGTVYRWNRPCYGIGNGIPHLRIEARFLPAGPTPLDEVANSALWFGLMSAISTHYDDITKVMEFDDAKNNFIAAARTGLDAQFTWIKGKRFTAQELLCKELIPLAREGLQSGGIDRSDIDRYLGVLEERIESGQTGSSWLVDSLNGMRKQGTKSERLAALTAATLDRQLTGDPVHKWPLASLSEAGGWRLNFQRVEQYMSTDLFTVHEDEIVDLVASIMDWRRIRHIPVEDGQHRLVGLVSYRQLLRYLARDHVTGKSHPIPVRELMEKDLVSVAPETPTLEAIALMKERRISCLPVVKDDRLVGIVTETDFLEVAGQLLEGFLTDPAKNDQKPNSE
ncbi:MAG: CBS domain-containing protein [Planctomycetota bacterium]